MADRRRQILLLLASRHDGLYHPPGALVTPAGLVPSQREPCSSCGGILLRDDFGKEIRRARGRGYTLDRFKRRTPCASCSGAGWIARDPMDSQGVRVGSATTTATARPRRTVTCDACNGEGVRAGDRCRRCDGAGRRDLHVFELHLDTRDVDERDPLATAIEARSRSGSYRELDRCLAILRTTDRSGYATLLQAIDTGVVPFPDGCEQALAFIDRRMPDPIRVPAEVTANHRELKQRRTRAHGRASDPRALEQRAKEMRRHAREGRSPQWIAAEYRVSVATVYQTVNGSVASR